MSLTTIRASNLDTTNSVSFRNRIINGDMQIDQRNNGAAVSAANGYITDRWTLARYTESTGVYSGQQVSDAPAGFTNSLRVTVTTAEASQGVNAYWQVAQHIEGFNTADLMFGTSSAATVTVSFWVKCSVVGTYSVCLFNVGVGSVDRSYATTYTINSANTWEYKTVTIPGDTTGGSAVWGKTNGYGISLFFDMGSGSGQQISANTWTTANARRVTGTTRLIATSGATWQVTGVQLEKGTAATAFEYLPYGTELALCQRYFISYGGSDINEQFGLGQADGTSLSVNFIHLPVEMRVAPSLSVSSVNDFRINDTSVERDVSGMVIQLPSTKVAPITSTVTASITQGRATRILARSTLNARIRLSAEL
jgi:hypothetical protein